jgi:signal transduction histidine kinase
MRLRVPRLRAPAARSLKARARRYASALARVPVFPAVWWLIVAGLVAADAAYVHENAWLPIAPVLIGIATMTPVAILLLRLSPLLAWAASMVVAVAYPLLNGSDALVLPWTPLQLIVGAVVLVVIGWTYRPLVLVLVLVGTVVCVGLGAANDPLAPIPGLAFAAAVALVVGRLAGARRRADRRVSERERQLAEESSRRVVLEERARIARELHDVVAHHMSVIVVQAETAPYRVGQLSAEAREAFDHIATDARTGLVEMRRLLGVLRNDAQPEQALTEPQPTLSDLDQLVDSARRAGLEAELVTAGDLGNPSAALGLTVYRLVQESLSNVVRHAPGARVLVSVARTDGTLQLAVRNGPPARAPDQDREPADGSAASLGSHGLAGMRERVALLDGRLSTSREPGGGFVVEATMPYEAAVGRPAGATT